MYVKIRAAIALIAVLATGVAAGSSAAADGTPILKHIKLSERSSFEFRMSYKAP